MNSQEVIATLNLLLQTTKDGAKGFRTCAKDVKKGSLTPVFESSAQRCDVGAAELETEIRKLGGEPATSGSVGGALHRRWTDIMSSVTGMEEHVVLEECERGEDAAMRHYEAALKEDLPADIAVIVRRQYAGVKGNHDRIHALRDQSATPVS
jgi:uncharacterized protein (TIGR02284 family)